MVLRDAGSFVVLSFSCRGWPLSQSALCPELGRPRATQLPRTLGRPRPSDLVLSSILGLCGMGRKARSGSPPTAKALRTRAHGSPRLPCAFVTREVTKRMSVSGLWGPLEVCGGVLCTRVCTVGEGGGLLGKAPCPACLYCPLPCCSLASFVWGWDRSHPSSLDPPACSPGCLPAVDGPARVCPPPLLPLKFLPGSSSSPHPTLQAEASPRLSGHCSLRFVVIGVLASCPTPSFLHDNPPTEPHPHS